MPDEAKRLLGRISMVNEDLFTAEQEMAEERAAILEFDGLLTREEAEKQGKLDAEEWRHACEVRHVMAIPSLSDRREYLAEVERKRGKAGADRLRESIRQEWLRKRIEMGGQA